jgi:hypothetical protein
MRVHTPTVIDDEDKAHDSLSLSLLWHWQEAARIFFLLFFPFFPLQLYLAGYILLLFQRTLVDPGISVNRINPVLNFQGRSDKYILEGSGRDF